MEKPPSVISHNFWKRDHFRHRGSPYWVGARCGSVKFFKVYFWAIFSVFTMGNPLFWTLVLATFGSLWTKIQSPLWTKIQSPLYLNILVQTMSSKLELRAFSIQLLWKHVQVS